MRPLGVIKIDPVFDDAFCMESVLQFMQMDRLLLQGPPQPFKEDVVEGAANSGNFTLLQLRSRITLLHIS